MDNIKPILFTAGQASINNSIINSLSKPVISSFSNDYVALMKRISKNIKKAFFACEDYYAFPLHGTGTAGMEAVVSSLTTKHTKVLVCENGYFGKRFFEISNIYSDNVVEYKIKWGDSFNLEDYEKIIKAKRPDIVYIVHGETSMGISNPIKEMSKIAKEYNCIVVVDCSSTFIGCEVLIKDWDIDVAFAVSQKCLGICAGICPVVIKKYILDNLCSNIINSVYLNLYKICHSWYPYSDYHITPSMNLLYALDKALENVINIGIYNRWKEQKDSFYYLKNELEIIGVNSCIQDVKNDLYTVLPVKSNKARQVQNDLLQKEIYVSSGYNDENILRIGLLSYPIEKDKINLLIENIRVSLERK